MTILTKKFSEFVEGGDLNPDDITVGLNGGVNTKFANPAPLLSPGTTAERPDPDPIIYNRLRFNTDANGFEFYSSSSMAWISIGDSSDIGDLPALIYKAYAPATSAINLGLLSSGVLFQTVTGGIATIDASYTLRIDTILDTNLLPVLSLATTPSSVNLLRIHNNSVGNYPILEAIGADADIGFNIDAKGLGTFNLNTQATSSAISLRTGPAQDHITNFDFSGSSSTRTVTFQDASGTLAFLSDIPGSFTWNDVTGITQAMLVSNGYKANNAARVTLTLPVSSIFGDVIQIAGFGIGGWKIAQGDGQSIIIGSSKSTPGVVGSVSSTNQYDCVVLTCMEDNLTWQAVSPPQGALDIL